METRNQWNGKTSQHTKYEAAVNNAAFTEYDLSAIAEANPHHRVGLGSRASILRASFVQLGGAATAVNIAHSAAAGAAGFYKVCTTTLGVVMDFPVSANVKSVWIQTVGAADLNIEVEYNI